MRPPLRTLPPSTPVPGTSWPGPLRLDERATDRLDRSQDAVSGRRAVPGPRVESGSRSSAVATPTLPEGRDLPALRSREARSVAAAEPGPDAASSPRSSLRMLRLLSVLSASPEGLTLAALSLSVRVPKSSLLTILKPLVTERYLAHRDARYVLGPESFTLATGIIGARKIGGLMRVFMEELWAETQETIILVTMDRANRCATYIDVIESPQSVRYVVPPGVTRSLHSSAGGRALLAHEDAAWLDAYLAAADLRPLTDRSPTDPAAIRDALAAVRARGVSVSLGEAVRGASGVAAPVFDQDGATVAALLIGAPADRAALNLEPWTALMKSVAGRASRAFGHRY